MHTDINIKLTKEHIPHIKEYYQTRLTALQTELAEINEIIKQLSSQESLANVNGQSLLLPQQSQSVGGYNPKWSLIKKAKFAITTAGRALTSKEIVDFIIDNYDTDLKEDRKRFMSSMSGTLSGKSKEGGIFKRKQNDADEFEYEIA
jgi:hypothetical protein